MIRVKEMLSLQPGAAVAAQMVADQRQRDDDRNAAVTIAVDGDGEFAPIAGIDPAPEESRDMLQGIDLIAAPRRS
jgi:hypothetical protein